MWAERFRRTVAKIIGKEKKLIVSAIAKEMGCSKTTLEKEIKKEMGISPKKLLNIRYYSDDMYSNSDSISIELWCKMSIA